MASLKKIVVIPLLYSQYEVMHNFLEELSFSLVKAGVECVKIKRDNKSFENWCQEILKEAPDCTLSYNGIFPSKGTFFLSDHLKIPHVACLVDPPHYFFPLTKSPFYIFGTADEYDVDFYKRIGVKNVFFFPHGTPKVEERVKGERPLEVVMLSTYMDFERKRLSWRTRFPPYIQKILENASQIILSDQTTPLFEALMQALKNPALIKFINPKKIDFYQLMFELEYYTKGKHRLNLVLSIEDVPIHIFGDKFGPTGWRENIPSSKKNIILHPGVPFTQIPEILKKSQIILHSSRALIQGGHERIFTAMSYGTIVMAGKNNFLEKNFKEWEEILFYDHFSEANEKIVTLLKDPQKREEMAEKAFQKVQKEHTWDERAKTFLKEVPPMIENVKRATMTDNNFL